MEKSTVCSVIDFQPVCEMLIDMLALISQSPLKNKGISCGEESTFKDGLKEILDKLYKKQTKKSNSDIQEGRLLDNCGYHT